MESLADIGLATMKRFKLLQEAELESVEKQSLEWPKHLFLAQFERFELWAVNLGVFVMGHGSLDYRIRDSEILAYLHGNIEQEDEDSDADSDSEMESDMDLLLDSIKDPVDRLYKMAVWIRNPSTRIASSKARNFQQIDEKTNIDLFKSYETFDYDYVSSLFLEYEKNKALQENPTAQHHDATGDNEEPAVGDQVWEPIRQTLELNRIKISNGNESYLVHRIAQANGLRRRQFAYWRKHKGKLREHTAVTVELLSHKLPTGDNIIQDESKRHKAPLTVTTATQLHPSHGAGKELLENENIMPLAVSEYAPSAWNPSKDIVSFPLPPKVSTADEFFECPYCYTICPASILSEKAWRAWPPSNTANIVLFELGEVFIAAGLIDEAIETLEHLKYFQSRQSRQLEFDDPALLRTNEQLIIAYRVNEAITEVARRLELDADLHTEPSKSKALDIFARTEAGARHAETIWGPTIWKDLQKRNEHDREIEQRLEQLSDSFPRSPVFVDDPSSPPDPRAIMQERIAREARDLPRLRDLARSRAKGKQQVLEKSRAEQEALVQQETERGNIQTKRDRELEHNRDSPQQRPVLPYDERLVWEENNSDISHVGQDPDNADDSTQFIQESILSKDYEKLRDTNENSRNIQPGTYIHLVAALEQSVKKQDPRYRFEPSSKFQPGEIFKIHWPETQGASSEDTSSESSKYEVQSRVGTRQILTYGGNGCTKKGVNPNEHGIIHERGSKPQLLDNEPKLGFPPVRVDIKEEGEKLSKESRVNYSRLVTVEHNIKVFFIGSIRSEGRKTPRSGYESEEPQNQQPQDTGDDVGSKHERLQKELVDFKAEQERAKEAANQRELEEKPRQNAEKALAKKIEELRLQKEESKKEVEHTRLEAERITRERIEAEKKAEEDRRRQHAEAMARAEETARLKFQAEIKAAEERRMREDEDRARAEEATRLRLEATIKAESADEAARIEEATRLRVEAAMKAEAEAKAAAAADRQGPGHVDVDHQAPGFNWTPAYEATLFRSLCESVQLGMRENNAFKDEAWERAARALQEHHRVYPAKGYLINKSDDARKSFRLWRGLREDPDFIYNPVARTVTATEEAWRAHIAGRPFDHEEYMELLYPDVINDQPNNDSEMPKQPADWHPALSGDAVDELKEGVLGYLVPLDPKYGDKPLVVRKRVADPSSAAVKASSLAAKVKYIAAGGYLIGRHHECDLIISELAVSNRHCLIFEENVGTDTVAIVEDLSSNGTYINEGLIGRNQRRELEDKDEIAVHDKARFIFRYPKSGNNGDFTTVDAYGEDWKEPNLPNRPDTRDDLPVLNTIVGQETTHNQHPPLQGGMGADMHQMAPPAINIDFAPTTNSREGSFEPPKSHMDQDSLTPPGRGKSFIFARA
ncbi:hypothetical protein TrVFT333_000178 [Trichoderma virens FT-333]|nr:hypothetical protein TrVFT333_000178 [Trichoderma virens FT-333]